MVFSSLFFVYLFLPLNLLFYWLMPGIRSKNIVMLVFSLLFYAWGEPVYILLLIGMTFADWLFAMYIEDQRQNSGKAKLGLFGACAVNLVLLAVFKYSGFLLSNLHSLTGFPSKTVDILLPIGISFYTFQLISYVVDVYRGEVPAQKSFYMLLLYVSMFHQCIAGPIVRYQDVCAELTSRRVSAADLSAGVWRFVTGLFKKAVLANACGAAADALLTASSGDTAVSLSQRPVIALWVGMLAFALQIYLDFSAYSDMAIGMGMMIGIHYRENFDYPYLSASVTEFWRRWHISLGSFFRDYVYIPLGGSRRGKFRNTLNLLIVWALTGLWHGASWNFVFWGLYFFVFLLLERLFLGRIFKRFRPAGHVYLLLVVFFGWILFKFRTPGEIFAVLSGMFGLGGNAIFNLETAAVLSSYGFLLAVSLLASTPLFRRIGLFIQSVSVENKPVFCLYAAGRILAPLLLMLMATAALVGDSYNPFLYFQF